MIECYGIRPDGYDQILVYFNATQEEFEEEVAANPNMTSIFGADDYTLGECHGVFIAGLKEYFRAGESADYLSTVMSDEEIKSVGEDIAEVVRVHKLVKRPDVCRALFSYMSDVVDGWNAGTSMVKRENMAGRCYGFRPDGYDQILVYHGVTKEEFDDDIAANDTLTAIMGADDYTLEHYPGVFIAGLKEYPPEDKV